LRVNDYVLFSVDARIAPVTIHLESPTTRGERAVIVSDSTLVNGVLSGDREAFAELYNRHARLIRAVCYDATRDLTWAADLTQEVFLRAFRGISDLRDPARFAPWLVGIARQVGREWRRAQRRQRRTIAGLQQEPQPTAVEEASRDADGVHVLREAITRLPEKERLALHVFYLLQMDAEQARGILELSRSGFYRVLSRVRRRLRRALSKVEVHP